MTKSRLVINESSSKEVWKKEKHTEMYLKQFVSAFVILCVISVRAKTENGQFPCGYNYFADAGGWFKMHEEGASVSEAKIVCNMEGAELASPTSDSAKDAMMSLMYQDELDNNEVLGVSTVHTGMLLTENLRNEAEFQDLNSESLSLTDKGQLKRVNQYIELPYICYRNASQYLKLNECGTTDPEYNLDNRTNKCYKFHRSKSTWSSAALTCLTEGGHLAIINSEQEANVIQELFEENPAEIIPGIDWKDSAFLGYFATVNLSSGYLSWSTIEEQTMSEAGYEEWSPGEPNNAGGEEYCVTVGRNGKLFDDPCFRMLTFICEKRTDNCVHQNAIAKISTVQNHIEILLTYFN